MGIPDQLRRILEAISPVARPRCFDLEDSIAEAIAAQPGLSRTERAALHLAVARDIFARITSCDVMYTYNVIQGATLALTEAQAVSETEIAFEAHCLLSRAYCFHQVGNKVDNLRIAHNGLDTARKLRPDLAKGGAWAEAVLDLARTTQLFLPNAPSWRRLYGEILDCVGEAEAPGLRQAARDHTSGRVSERASITLSTIEAGEAALSGSGERMLTREPALLADKLGERYLERGWPGDRERAIRCFQSAERSFYYLEIAPEVRALNQLHIARWLLAAEIEDVEDLEYVLNKALMAVNLAAALTPPERYPDTHAACYLVAAQVYDATGQDDSAVASLRQGLEFALPGSRSWRELRARLGEHGQGLF